MRLRSVKRGPFMGTPVLGIPPPLCHAEACADLVAHPLVWGTVKSAACNWAARGRGQDGRATAASQKGPTGSCEPGARRRGREAAGLCLELLAVGRAVLGQVLAVAKRLRGSRGRLKAGGMEQAGPPRLSACGGSATVCFMGLAKRPSFGGGGG